MNFNEKIEWWTKIRLEAKTRLVTEIGARLEHNLLSSVTPLTPLILRFLVPSTVCVVNEAPRPRLHPRLTDRGNSSRVRHKATHGVVP